MAVIPFRGAFSRFRAPASPRRRRFRKVRIVALQALVLCGLKLMVHHLGLELISVNQLFSAMVASTVFLLGFLLSGVLTDFKESEKIPAEIATSLESLSLEIRAISVYCAEADVRAGAEAVAVLGQAILDWLHERISLDRLMRLYRQAHAEVVAVSAQFHGEASTLRGRLMQDLALILAKINRVQSIRDTSFVPLVYWMADIASVLLFAGLLMARAQNLVESLFFIAVISFLVILLIRLIEDIDNPFGFADPGSAEDVSLDLLEQAVKRLEVPTG